MFTLDPVVQVTARVEWENSALLTAVRRTRPSLGLGLDSEKEKKRHSKADTSRISHKCLGAIRSCKNIIWNPHPDEQHLSNALDKQTRCPGLPHPSGRPGALKIQGQERASLSPQRVEQRAVTKKYSDLLRRCCALRLSTLSAVGLSLMFSANIFLRLFCTCKRLPCKRFSCYRRDAKFWMIWRAAKHCSLAAGSVLKIKGAGLEFLFGWSIFLSLSEKDYTFWRIDAAG